MDFVQLSLIVVVAGAVFFLFREIFTWYWKLNEIVNNQKAQIELMKKQNQLLEEALGKRTGKEIFLDNPTY